VTAGRQRQPHERVARLEQGEKHGLVGLRAGVRLDIGEGATEQLLGAVDRELLGDVDVLAAAVVAPPRIALGVFVGQHRALRLEHRARDDVLGGDQLDLVALTCQFVADCAPELGVGIGETSGEESIGIRGTHRR
jgi:hypothetical protein